MFHNGTYGDNITTLEDLNFADVLENQIHYVGRIGLKINLGKPKLMRFDPQSNQRLP
jgi:hypothetical protein